MIKWGTIRTAMAAPTMAPNKNWLTYVIAPNRKLTKKTNPYTALPITTLMRGYGRHPGLRPVRRCFVQTARYVVLQEVSIVGQAIATSGE